MNKTGRNMVSKIILDANLLLDLILKRSDDYDNLCRIYQEVIDHNLKGYITTSIIHIVGYWLEKEMGISYAKKILITTLNDLRVIEASHTVAEDALYSDMKDIEDALQYYTAIHNKLDVFISRDKGFIKSSKSVLPVMHPKDFIKEYID